MSTNFNDLVFNKLSETLENAFPEILTVFFQETELCIEEIKINIDGENWNEVINLAHKIKSSAKTFGATGLAEILEQIEYLDYSSFSQEKQGFISLHEKLQSEYALTKIHILSKL